MTYKREKSHRSKVEYWLYIQNIPCRRSLAAPSKGPQLAKDKKDPHLIPWDPRLPFRVEITGQDGTMVWLSITVLYIDMYMVALAKGWCSHIMYHHMQSIWVGAGSLTEWDVYSHHNGTTPLPHFFTCVWSSSHWDVLLAYFSRSSEVLLALVSLFIWTQIWKEGETEKEESHHSGNMHKCALLGIGLALTS